MTQGKQRTAGAGTLHGVPLAWETPVQVELFDEWLQYRWGELNEAPGTAEWTPGLLEDFLQLEHAAPEAIAAFARRFGVLELCEHGVPVSHQRPHCRALSPSVTYPPGGGYSGAIHPALLAHPDDLPDHEPLDAWRYYARLAAATGRICSALRLGRPGEDSDWDAVAAWTGRPPPEEIHLEGDSDWFDTFLRERRPQVWARENSDLVEERDRAADLLSLWFWLGDVRPQVEWMGERPELTLATSGLCGALAVSLLGSAGRESWLVSCTLCGMAYVTTTKPREGVGHYCPSCGRAGAQRRYSRESMRRKRDKKRREDEERAARAIAPPIANGGGES